VHRVLAGFGCCLNFFVQTFFNLCMYTLHREKRSLITSIKFSRVRPLAASAKFSERGDCNSLYIVFFILFLFLFFSYLKIVLCGGS
jgi:hypothetical protein